MDDCEWVVAPLRLGEVVYAEVYDAKAGHYFSVMSLVKGRWRVHPSDRYPWLVVVELRCDVGEGYGYEALDVVPVEPGRVSRSQSAAVAPVGSEFGQIHTRDLPEVRFCQYRLVE